MTEQNEYLCASCAVGLFDECSNPRSTDQEGYFLPCGLDMIAQAANEQLEKGQRGGQDKALDELTDDVSAGRKRAARLAPIMSGMRCEWAGLKFAGGGPVPILGCLETTIADVKQVDKAREVGADDVGHRHHGPDKAVMNNAVGMNLHRICSTCHNRWHTLNDAHYGARPHVSKPFLPNVPYYGHDGFTSFTGDEYKIAEAWWAKPVDERGPYPFTPEARKLAPLSTPEFTAADPFTGSDPFGE